MSENKDDRKKSKKFGVDKLYVGGRSRELLEKAAVALIQDGGFSKLSEKEKKLYQRAMLERGASAPTAVMELALASMLERLSGEWLPDEVAIEEAMADEEGPSQAVEVGP